MPKLPRLPGRVVFQLAALLWLAMVARDIHAQQRVTAKDPFIIKLSQPMNSIVDGDSFLEGLNKIAASAGLNLCLDRHVDPSRPIRSGPLGPTVFGSLAQLAADHDCVLMPVDDVVLVGRDTWVDRTVATLASLTGGPPRIADTIHWSQLATPTEALAAALDGEAPLQPPHDLWPQTTWHKLDRRVAIALILAQFDTYPVWESAAESERSLAAFRVRRHQDQPLADLTIEYETAGDEETLKAAVAEVDSDAQTRTRKTLLSVTATPAAHRAAVDAWFNRQPASGPDPDRDTFTLKKMRTSAANAFAQLAQTAGRKLQIEPNAEAACRKMVSLEGQDVTLRQLIDQVAAQVGVRVQWQPQTLTVSAADNTQP